MAMPEVDPSPRPVSGRRRLRTRIILSFFLFGLALTAMFAAATIQIRQRLEDQAVSEFLARNIDASVRQYLLNPQQDLNFPVENIVGRVVGPKKREALREEQPTWYAASDGVHPIQGVEPDGRPFAYMLAVRKTPENWFFLAYDQTRAFQARKRLNQGLWITAAVFGLLSLLLGWWSASRVMSPVLELARRIRKSKADSDPEALAPHFADDEVGEVARALDDYADRLTDVVQRDREFNADVSHELRTPLAVIKGAVELLLSQPQLDDKTRTRLQRIQRAESQCTDLISALLLLSRSERGQGHTDVARLLDGLIDAHRMQAGNKPVDIVMEGERGLAVAAPEAAVSVALGNLIGNAVKYTAQGRVVVRLLDAAVEVVDDGPGLSADDAAHLFQRGYRGTHAGRTQGGGIGLSIVSRLCELYGWQASVQPRSDGHGAVARLDFAPPPA